VTQGEAPPRHVEIKMVAPNENWPALQAVLSELLSRQQVTVRFASIASVDAHQILNEHSNDPPAVARVWIDLRDPNRVTLYLTGAREDRVLVRHVPLVTRLDEVAREEIAHIVEATVEALLVGGRIDIVADETYRKTVKAEPTVPPPSERAPTGVALDLAIAYEAQGWSASTPLLHSAALFLGVEARSGSLRPGAWISGEYRFPTTIEGPLVSARLDQGAFRAVATLDWAAAKRWLLGLGIGGGIDLVRVSPSANAGANVDPAPAYFATLPMLRAMGVGRYAFTPRTELFAGIAVDYDLLGTRYLLHQDSRADTPVFQPWRVRPMALIGVASDVLAH
jgi:hypothetical protein